MQLLKRMIAALGEKCTTAVMNLGGVAVLAGTALEIAGTGLSQGSTIVGAFAPSQIADGFTELHLVAIALRMIGAIAIIQIPTLASVKALGEEVGPAQTTQNRSCLHFEMKRSNSSICLRTSAIREDRTTPA